MVTDVTDIPYCHDTTGYRTDTEFQAAITDIILKAHNIRPGETILFNRHKDRYEFVHFLAPEGLITEPMEGPATERQLLRYHVECACTLIEDAELQPVKPDVLQGAGEIVAEYVETQLRRNEMALSRQDSTPGLPVTNWGDLRDSLAFTEFNPAQPDVGEYEFTSPSASQPATA